MRIFLVLSLSLTFISCATHPKPDPIPQSYPIKASQINEVRPGVTSTQLMTELARDGYLCSETYLMAIFLTPASRALVSRESKARNMESETKIKQSIDEVENEFKKVDCFSVTLKSFASTRKSDSGMKSVHLKNWVFKIVDNAGKIMDTANIDKNVLNRLPKYERRNYEGHWVNDAMICGKKLTSPLLGFKLVAIPQTGCSERLELSWTKE